MALEELFLNVYDGLLFISLKKWKVYEGDYINMQVYAENPKWSRSGYLNLGIYPLKIKSSLSCFMKSCSWKTSRNGIVGGKIIGREIVLLTYLASATCQSPMSGLWLKRQRKIMCNYMWWVFCPSIALVFCVIHDAAWCYCWTHGVLALNIIQYLMSLPEYRESRVGKGMQVNQDQKAWRYVWNISVFTHLLNS